MANEMYKAYLAKLRLIQSDLEYLRDVAKTWEALIDEDNIDQHDVFLMAYIAEQLGDIREFWYASDEEG